MSDMAILGLAGFMFVGLPLIILGVAFAIDRLTPAKPESKQAAPMASPQGNRQGKPLASR